MHLDLHNKMVGDLPEKIILSETPVVLLSGFYAQCDMNPAWGSEYACIGVVVRYSKGTRLQYRVQWENGAHNNYHGDELRIYSSNSMGGDNPNRAFKVRRKGICL